MSELLCLDGSSDFGQLTSSCDLLFSMDLVRKSENSVDQWCVLNRDGSEFPSPCSARRNFRSYPVAEAKCPDGLHGLESEITPLEHVPRSTDAILPSDSIQVETVGLGDMLWTTFLDVREVSPPDHHKESWAEQEDSGSSSESVARWDATDGSDLSSSLSPASLEAVSPMENQRCVSHTSTEEEIFRGTAEESTAPYDELDVTAFISECLSGGDMNETGSASPSQAGFPEQQDVFAVDLQGSSEVAGVVGEGTSCPFGSVNPLSSDPSRLFEALPCPTNQPAGDQSGLFDHFRHFLGDIQAISEAIAATTTGRPIWPYLPPAAPSPRVASIGPATAPCPLSLPFPRHTAPTPSPSSAPCASTISSTVPDWPVPTFLPRGAIGAGVGVGVGAGASSLAEPIAAVRREIQKLDTGTRRTLAESLYFLSSVSVCPLTPAPAPPLSPSPRAAQSSRRPKRSRRDSNHQAQPLTAAESSLLQTILLLGPAPGRASCPTPSPRAQAGQTHPPAARVVTPRAFAAGPAPGPGPLASPTAAAAAGQLACLAGAGVGHCRTGGGRPASPSDVLRPDLRTAPGVCFGDGVEVLLSDGVWPDQDRPAQDGDPYACGALFASSPGSASGSSGDGMSKRRVFFTPEQTQKLNECYERLAPRGVKCSPDQVAEIARDVGITDHQVRIYFQNKRARCRNRSPEHVFPGPSLKRPFSALDLQQQSFASAAFAADAQALARVAQLLT